MTFEPRIKLNHNIYHNITFRMGFCHFSSFGPWRKLMNGDEDWNPLKLIVRNECTEPLRPTSPEPTMFDVYDLFRSVSLPFVLYRKAFSTMFDVYDLFRSVSLFLSEKNCNMSNRSNIVGTEEVGPKGSVHSFLTIYYTSALVSSSPFPFSRGTRGRQGTQGTPGTQEDTREHRGNNRTQGNTGDTRDTKGHKGTLGTQGDREQKNTGDTRKHRRHKGFKGHRRHRRHKGAQETQKTQRT